MTSLSELVSHPMVNLLTSALLSAVFGAVIMWAGRKLLNTISTKFRERREKQSRLLSTMVEVLESDPIAIVSMSTTLHFDRIEAHLLAVEALVAFVLTIIAASTVPGHLRNTIFFVLFGIVWAASLYTTKNNLLKNKA
jgi:hypothetical protein